MATLRNTNAAAIAYRDKLRKEQTAWEKQVLASIQGRPGLAKTKGKTLAYKDCPTCHGRQTGFQCNTCAIRNRQANEPDNWLFKPRNHIDAMRAVSHKYAALPQRKVSDVWADMQHLDVPPDVKQRFILVRCINWGVNVDHITVPADSKPVRTTKAGRIGGKRGKR